MAPPSKKKTELPDPPDLKALIENVREVDRLMDIHEELTGGGPGRRAGVEVLNKSAVVLLVACWETYIEDLASRAFDLLLSGSKDHTAFPRRVLTLASKDLRSDDDESKIWALAGSGWKRVLRRHRADVFKRFVGRLNTPKADNINRLFGDLIGLRGSLLRWSWSGMKASSTTAKLDRLVTLRGEIAHRVRTSESVHKADVEDFTTFVMRLAGVVSNTVREHVEDRVGVPPWLRVTYVGGKAKKA